MFTGGDPSISLTEIISLVTIFFVIQKLLTAVALSSDIERAFSWFGQVHTKLSKSSWYREGVEIEIFAQKIKINY